MDVHYVRGVWYLLHPVFTNRQKQPRYVESMYGRLEREVEAEGERA